MRNELGRLDPWIQGWMGIEDTEDEWREDGGGMVPKRKASYWVKVSGEATGISGLGGAYILVKTSSDKVSGTLTVRYLS